MLSSFRTGCALALAAVLGAGLAQAQTVDQVVAKNLQGRGGVEKLKAMTSTKMTADVDTRGTKLHIVTWAKRPNQVRRETDGMPPPPTPGRVSIPGSTGPVKVVVASDGTTVWTINPMTGEGAQEITGPQANMAKDEADFDSGLIDYKSKGTTIELVGSEPINGKPAYHLKLAKKNGMAEDYYLDVETGLEVRRRTIFEQGGAPTEVAIDLSNYKTVDGLTLPFTMKQSVNGTLVAEVTVSKWEVNIPMDDELFKMPAKK